MQQRSAWAATVADSDGRRCSPKCNGTHTPCRGFHSGRNYGTHSSWSDGEAEYTTIVAGDTNGNFKNVMCNVSRFIALLRSLIGQVKIAIF